MRYLGILLFFATIPALIALIRSSGDARRWVWFALGAAPFVDGWLHLYVSLVSWAYWPGHVKGLIVALPDLLAIGLLATTANRGRSTPITAVFIAYICFSAVSIFFADVPVASSFWIWQLGRSLLMSIVVARVVINSDAPRHIVAGLCAGTLFQAFFSISQRIHGVVQATGTMGHQNLVGMMTTFAFVLALSLVLNGDRRLILKVGILSSIVVIVLSGSRATLGFAGGGAALLLLLSMIRNPTPQKYKIAGGAIAMLLLAIPVAYNTLQKRFAAAQYDGDYDERAAFKRAANAMWRDHPMGVGANEYVIVANTKGYSKNAGVAASSGSRAANVHNAFLLIAAETGYLGLIGIVALFLTAIVTAFRTAWARPSFRYSELALGAGVTLVAVGSHNLYEWIFVTEGPQYLFGMTLGLIGGLTAQRKLFAKRPAAERHAPRTPVLSNKVREAHGDVRFI